MSLAVLTLHHWKEMLLETCDCDPRLEWRREICGCKWSKELNRRKCLDDLSSDDDE